MKKGLNYLLLSSALAFGVSCQKDNIKPQTPTNSLETLKLEGNFKIKRASIGVKPLMNWALGYFGLLENPSVRVQKMSNPDKIQILLLMEALKRACLKIDPYQISNKDSYIYLYQNMHNDNEFSSDQGVGALVLGQYLVNIFSEITQITNTYTQGLIGISEQNDIILKNIDLKGDLELIIAMTSADLFLALKAIILAMPSIATYQEYVAIQSNPAQLDNFMYSLLSQAISALNSDEFLAFLNPFEKFLNDISINRQNDNLLITYAQKDFLTAKILQETDKNLEISFAYQTNMEVRFAFDVLKNTNSIQLNLSESKGFSDFFLTTLRTKQENQMPMQDFTQQTILDIRAKEQYFILLFPLVYDKSFKSFLTFLLGAFADIVSLPEWVHANMIDDVIVKIPPKDFLVLTLTPTP
jgi:hypothetical protein